MFAEGMWYVYSEEDPRWNKQAEGMVGLSLYDQHSDAYRYIEEMKAILGEAPSDLIIGYHKY